MKKENEGRFQKMRVVLTREMDSIQGEYGARYGRSGSAPALALDVSSPGSPLLASSRGMLLLGSPKESAVRSPGGVQVGSMVPRLPPVSPTQSRLPPPRSPPLTTPPAMQRTQSAPGFP